MGKCFRCNKPAHRSNECPLRKFLNLISELDDYKAKQKEEPRTELEKEEDADPVFGDEGERVSCVVQRLLLTPKQEGNNQRHSIFQTRCIVNHKACDLIIDNFVSKVLVKALNLPTKKHPSPYKIGWIKKGVEVTVDSICQVCLSIGQHYQDIVLCDVIDMDSSHLLFGRPWEYDVDAKNLGRSNNYEFTMLGKRITLMPLPNSSKASGNIPRSRKILFTAHGRFLEQDFQAAKLALTVLIMEGVQESQIVLEEVQGLLQDFSDVVPIELLDCLPPMREIQHHIDLVPGSWRMCVDSRAINKITVNYHFPIPRSEDMLDKLEGSKLFSRLDLRSGYHHPGMNGKLHLKQEKDYMSGR